MKTALVLRARRESKETVWVKSLNFWPSNCLRVGSAHSQVCRRNLAPAPAPVPAPAGWRWSLPPSSWSPPPGCPPPCRFTLPCHPPLSTLPSLSARISLQDFDGQFAHDSCCCGTRLKEGICGPVLWLADRTAGAWAGPMGEREWRGRQHIYRDVSMLEISSVRTYNWLQKTWQLVLGAGTSWS